MQESEEKAPLITAQGLAHMLIDFYQRKDIKSLLSILPTATCESILAICEFRATLTGDSIEGFTIEFEDEEETSSIVLAQASDKNV